MHCVDKCSVFWHKLLLQDVPSGYTYYKSVLDEVTAWHRETHHDLNTLRPRQHGHHFAYDIFKCIFLNENAIISIKISLKFVSKASTNNIPPLVQIMAWRRAGDKPLSELMMFISLTHICVTRPQWVNSSYLGENGCHITGNIVKCIFVNENFAFWFGFHWKLFPMVQLIISQHWFG